MHNFLVIHTNVLADAKKRMSSISYVLIFGASVRRSVAILCGVELRGERCCYHVAKVSLLGPRTPGFRHTLFPRAQDKEIFLSVLPRYGFCGRVRRNLLSYISQLSFLYPRPLHVYMLDPY